MRFHLGQIGYCWKVVYLRSPIKVSWFFPSKIKISISLWLLYCLTVYQDEEASENRPNSISLSMEFIVATDEHHSKVPTILWVKPCLVIGGVNIFIECNIFGWHQHTDTLLINKHVSQIYLHYVPLTPRGKYPLVLESVEGLNGLCSGKCGKWFHGFPPHTMRLVSGLITCCNWWRAGFIIWLVNRRFTDVKPTDALKTTWEVGYSKQSV